MDWTILFSISSGLFLGCSLGENDAANVFGTAVGSRMVKFGTAAVVASIFVILGATISGAGTVRSLGALGNINALGGSFIVALSAAVTVIFMSRIQPPVSTGQAIIGAIIGWNLFSGTSTDIRVFTRIASSWLMGPLLSGVTAVILYMLIKKALDVFKPHLLDLVGVFVNASPFADLNIGHITLSSVQQLFFVGALAIAIGICLFSKKAMLTIGNKMMPLTPITAWIVVMAHSIVLFLFSSEGLEFVLASHGLPTIPLVPISSSQVIVGAIVGISLLKGGQQLDWKVLLRIIRSWFTTPPIAMLVCLLMLTLAQNVFMINVYNPVHYRINDPVIERAKETLSLSWQDQHNLKNMRGKTFAGSDNFQKELGKRTGLNRTETGVLTDIAQVVPVSVQLHKMESEWLLSLKKEQLAALQKLEGREYIYRWQFELDLATLSTKWQPWPDTVLNKPFNNLLYSQLDQLVARLTI